MKKLTQGFTAVELAVALVAVIGIGGWVANIVKLIGSDLMPLTWMAIARVIGIFVAPLGSVLGFF